MVLTLGFDLHALTLITGSKLPSNGFVSQPQGASIHSPSPNTIRIENTVNMIPCQPPYSHNPWVVHTSRRAPTCGCGSCVV